MATLQEITDRVKTAVGDDSGLGKTMKFDLKGDGFIHIHFNFKLDKTFIFCTKHC